jgi:general secretion pathway protein H
LVEVLIVVGLIAVLTGAIVFGSGMLVGAKQRAAATLVVSAVRMGLTRANQTGKPVRLVFDLDQKRLLLEEGSGADMLRVRNEDGKHPTAGAEPATEAEKQAEAESDRILKGPRAPRPRFEPVKSFGHDGDDPKAGRELGRGVKYRQVHVEHDETALTEGRAYLYLWPGGSSERAAIQILREGADSGVTVMVSGLSGRARIEQGFVKLPEPRSDEDGVSERSEQSF